MFYRKKWAPTTTSGDVAVTQEAQA